MVNSVFNFFYENDGLKLCFWGLGALLLGSGSIAFEAWKHCFWGLGAMLLGSESNAFGGWEQCFWSLGAML